MGHRRIGRTDPTNFSCQLFCDGNRGKSPLEVSYRLIVHNPNGGIDRISINASDGQSSNDSVGSFIFLHPGQHSIRAQVIDSQGQIAEAVAMAEVTEWPEELGLSVLNAIGTYIPVQTQQRRPVPARGQPPLSKNVTLLYLST